MAHHPLGPPIAGALRSDGYLEIFFPYPAVRVAVLVEDVEGRPEIVGLEVKPVREIRTELAEEWAKVSEALRPRRSKEMEREVPFVLKSDILRQLPLRQLRDIYLMEVANGKIDFQLLNPTVEHGPKPPSDELVRAVAETYSQALTSGTPILAAIQARHHIARATATKYIRLAREAGYLGWPSKKGSAGIGATKSPFTRVNQTPKNRTRTV